MNFVGELKARRKNMKRKLRANERKDPLSKVSCDALTLFIYSSSQWSVPRLDSLFNSLRVIKKFFLIRFEFAKHFNTLPEVKVH